MLARLTLGTIFTAALLVIAAALTFTPAHAATPPTPTDKLVILVIENHSMTQMKTGAPKIWALSQQYGYATNFTAITHPSLPNYIALASGSTQGVKDDKPPSSHKLKAQSVFAAAWANGRKAAVVGDYMYSDRCRQTDYKSFAVRHTGWPYFPAERALCEKYMFDFKYFAGDVAAGRIDNLEWVIPSNANNAHSGSLKTADNWIAARVATMQAGPDWAAGRLTIVITADEDDRHDGNRILTTVINPGLSHKVVTTQLSLYSLTRMEYQYAHATPPANAATAPDMATAFGLVVQ